MLISINSQHSYRMQHLKTVHFSVCDVAVDSSDFTQAHGFFFLWRFGRIIVILFIIYRIRILGIRLPIIFLSIQWGLLFVIVCGGFLFFIYFLRVWFFIIVRIIIAIFLCWIGFIFIFRIGFIIFSLFLRTCDSVQLLCWQCCCRGEITITKLTVVGNTFHGTTFTLLLIVFWLDLLRRIFCLVISLIINIFFLLN